MGKRVAVPEGSLIAGHTFHDARASNRPKAQKFQTINGRFWSLRRVIAAGALYMSHMIRLFSVPINGASQHFTIQDKFGMNRQCTHLFCTSHIRPLWKSGLFPQILINKQGIVWRGIRTHDRGLSVHCNTTLLSCVAVDAFPKTQFHTMRELNPRPLGPKPSALL